MTRLIERLRAAARNLRRSLLTKLNLAASTLAAFAIGYPSAMQDFVLGNLPDPVRPYAIGFVFAWFALVQWAQHRDAKPKEKGQ